VVDVLGVHGIGQQQQGRNQLLPTWQAALNDGVERARDRQGAAPPDLDIAYYGDLFLPATDTKGSSAAGDKVSLAPIKLDHNLVGNADDVDSGMPDDLVSFFLDIENEVVDPKEKLGDEQVKGRLSPKVSRLAAWLEAKFGVADKFLFFGDLTQVRRFQTDDELASKVLERVREGLQTEPRILIGHSLGSVVAYEALCRIADHGITTLITVGSPLGLRSIREALSSKAIKRIPDLPPGVTRWVNVYDRGDPVCLAGGLDGYWSDVKDKTVNNGRDAHGIGPYLGKREVGLAVVDALK
jgi:predicted alpha/beta hydrolase family esterase